MAGDNDSERHPWDHGYAPTKKFPVYTRGNVAEVFPYPMSPLMAGTILPPGEAGWRSGLEQLGGFDANEFRPECTEVENWFNGYLYINLSVLRVLGNRIPGMEAAQMDAGLVGEHPDTPAHVCSDVDVSPAHSEKLAQTLAAILSTEFVSGVAEDRQRADRMALARPDLTAVSDAGLVDYLRTSALEVHTYMTRTIYIAMAASIAAGLVANLCAQTFGDGATGLNLLAGLGDIASAAPSYDMWDVSRIVARSAAVNAEFDKGVVGLLDRLRQLPEAAEFLVSFDAFIQKYAWRGPNEYDPVSKTWGTCPELALAGLERMRLASEDAAPRMGHERMVTQRKDLLAATLDKLKDTPEMAAQLEAGIKAAKAFLTAREGARINMVLPIHEARLAVRELGSRMVARQHLVQWEDIQLLTNEELDEFVADPAAFGDTIKRRCEAFVELSELVPPFFIDGVVPPLSSYERRSYGEVGLVAPGTALHGIGGCAGTVTAVARVILDPMDPSALQPGEILVAPGTDPAWTPLFVPAAAVVVDTGALISHAVIVCRELGLPCVVSVKDATQQIRDGALITV
jgi:pyruvate,water dikinase